MQAVLTPPMNESSLTYWQKANTEKKGCVQNGQVGHIRTKFSVLLTIRENIPLQVPL